MQDNNLWQTVLGEIELTVTRGNFVTWFKNTRVIERDNAHITIGVPNIFIKQQLETKYNHLITETLGKNGITDCAIAYKITPIIKVNRRDDDVISPRSETNSRPSLLPRARSSQISTLSHNYRQGLNDRYTFDSFVVGSGNEMAHAACQAVAAQIGTKYNPLFLYGGVGIGKTHLIQAVGNQAITKNPNIKVVYASTEQFTQEFVDALRFRKTTDFAKHYRSADILIVDDMQFIAGKEKVQEEFFHTFNALHQASKQIIISSDRPPREIPTLEERLASRFSMGMSIDMQNPDFETRCAIIKTKAHLSGAYLPDDVVDYLAHLVQTNIRELEGVLNQLLAFCEMRGIDPTLAIATNLLGTSRDRPKHINAKQIIERTAREFQITLEDITGAKRDKDIVVPRQIAMYMLRSELHLSFPKIAHELGRRDHTTAIHAVDKISKELQLDVDLKQSIEDIRDKLYA